jgi:outer membrane protein
MKIDRLLTAFAFLATVALTPVLAQTRPTSQPAAPPATQASAPIPESKIALINSEAFLYEKGGVARLIAGAKKVELEFEPRRKELQLLTQKIQQLTDEINKLQAGSGVVSQEQIQTKIDQLEQMKKDGKRKQEDAEAAYPKRVQEVLAPIYDEIGTALQAFGKARGITLILDAKQLGPAILMAADATDITAAFIADFNTRNPATAQVTPR